MNRLTLNQFITILEKYDERIAKLQDELAALKSWVDINDYYIKEMCEANSSALDCLQQAISELHDAETINQRVEELKNEDTMPIAQLVLAFVDEHLTEEERAELNQR